VIFCESIVISPPATIFNPVQFILVIVAEVRFISSTVSSDSVPMLVKPLAVATVLPSSVLLNTFVPSIFKCATELLGLERISISWFDV